VRGDGAQMTHTLSVSQFGELLAIDPAKIAGISLDPSTRLIRVEETDMAHTSGTFPPLTKGGKTIGGKKPGKGGKKGC
jgi:hypothetical protein